MAKKLHSVDILNSISFSILFNLQKLSNNHLASVLVNELSQDIKERKKFIAFLDTLKKEPSLAYIYYKISFLSKYHYIKGVFWVHMYTFI